MKWYKSNWARYIGGGLASGALGSLGTLGVEFFTKATYPIVLITVVAFLLGFFFLQVDTLARILAGIGQQVDGLEPETQPLSTRLGVAVIDVMGAEATMVKESVFRANTSTITVIRDNLLVDGGCPPPTFELWRLADGDDPESSDATWTPVGRATAMSKAESPYRALFPDDWVISLQKPLEKGAIYRKRVAFQLDDTYLGKEEWHSHALELEHRCRIEFTFGRDYGGGLPEAWMNGADGVPGACLRRRHSGIETVPPSWVAPDLGGIKYTYLVASPQLGDKFRLTWTNPNGMAEADKARYLQQQKKKETGTQPVP